MSGFFEKIKNHVLNYFIYKFYIMTLFFARMSLLIIFISFFYLESTTSGSMFERNRTDS